MRTIWIGLLSLGCAVGAAFWGCGDTPEMPTGPASGPSTVASTGAGGAVGTGGADGGTTGTGGGTGGNKTGTGGNKTGTGGTTAGTGGADGGTTGTGGSTAGTGGADGGTTGTGGSVTGTGGGNDGGTDASTEGGTCTGTDVDCGGTCPMPCGVGKKCVANADCTTGVCQSGKCQLLNGCDPTTATDVTGTSNTTVHFPGAVMPFAYSPSCLIVSAGVTTVVFSGDFTTYALQGGVVQGTTGTPAAAGTTPLPTTTTQSTGMSTSYMFPTAGAFGFYCPTQLPDMQGAVFVK